jgi:two-component system, cell cycle response regulator CpdR
MNDERDLPPDPSPLPLRMLYVEDNALVREITCDLLAGDIREIIAVATGEEAIRIFNAGRFDLVVTDVSLPAMSGLDLMRRIKEVAPSMPIILASGYPLDPADYRLGPSIRAITKPFSPPELRALIQELCRVTA